MSDMKKHAEFNEKLVELLLIRGMIPCEIKLLRENTPMHKIVRCLKVGKYRWTHADGQSRIVNTRGEEVAKVFHNAKDYLEKNPSEEILKKYVKQINVEEMALRLSEAICSMGMDENMTDKDLEDRNSVIEMSIA
jgi:hypothetical protein